MIRTLVQMLFSFLTFTMASGQVGKQSQSIYDSALNVIADHFVKEKRITNKDVFIIDSNKILFKLDDFAPKAINSSEQKQMFDSLNLLSRDLNLKCPNIIGSNFLSNEKVKNVRYIVFFSEFCSDKLQANVFFYDPSLKSDKYLYDYYGEYYTFLLEFSKHGSLYKFSHSMIHGN